MILSDHGLKNAIQTQRFQDGQIVNIDYNTNLNLVKWGIFGQVSKNVFNERMTLSLGLRTDANNYSSSMSNMFKQFSPRFSASYSLTNQWSLNFNTGRYYQLPAYTTLGYQENNIFVNKENDLQYISVDHLIGGLEFCPSSTVLFSLEGFLKNYKNYPYSINDSISLANKGTDFGVVGDEAVLSTSKGHAYGVEFQTRINGKKGNFEPFVYIGAQRIRRFKGHFFALKLGFETSSCISRYPQTEKQLARWRPMTFCGRTALHSLES